MLSPPDAQETRRYFVHTADDGRHRADTVIAPTPDAAAVGFLEHWAGAGEVEVRVIVTDCANGEERCFLFDLEAGEAEACN